MTETVKTR